MLTRMNLADTPATRLRATDPAEWPGLMARAQAGDSLAYRRLLDGIAPLLRGVARRALREAADVEDTVQDILLTVHKARHTYDPARPFRPWLLAIARHRIVDRLRTRGRIAANEIALEIAHLGVAAEDPPPGGGLDGRVLQSGLSALPIRQREAVTLLKLEDLSLAEASARSGQSIAALKVATHRGIRRLRGLLAGRDGAK